MNQKRTVEGIILGAFICAGLLGLGVLLGNGALRVKSLDRTVTVKGLSEREVPADIAIWPIIFNEADNDLAGLYSTLEEKTAIVVAFLKKHGFGDEEITVAAPAIVDRQAQNFGDQTRIKYRYAARAAISVYTEKVEAVRQAMNQLVDLGKQGIAIAGDDYQTKTQFLFTGLNDLKPQMIEEATKNARQVAEKFARDSDSRLGKIRKANQGQFTIEDRDSNTPHIKKVRVVSTVEYYLSD